MSSTALYTPQPAGAMPATLVNATTGELPVLNPAILNPQNAPTNPGVALTALMLLIPSGLALERKLWGATFAGVLATTATSTATLKVRYVPNSTIVAGTSTTLANSTVLGTSGAVNQNTATSPFIAKLTDCIFDSGTGKLNGKIEFSVNATLVAAAEFSTIVTTVSNANDPILGLMITLTPSAGTMTMTVTDASINF